MALELARREIHVVIHYNSSEGDALHTVADIEGAGGRAACIRADLRNEREVCGLIQRSAELIGGRLSVLINNAAIFERDGLPDATRASWDRHFEINLRAPFVLMQEFANELNSVAAGPGSPVVPEGCIINMLDPWVLRPGSGFTSYTLAKSGLWTLTKIAAIALAPQIRVNGIGPGPTLPGPRQSQGHFDRQRRETVLGRGPEIEDIVGAMSYLLDARSVTGQMIRTDCGFHPD